MWCQNVASLAHLASGSQFASPDVASKHGVTCPPGVREPGGVDGDVPGFTPLVSPGVMGRVWHQNVVSLAHVASESHVSSSDVASLAMDLRGVAGRGVNTCFQNASSVVGRYVHPHRLAW